MFPTTLTNQMADSGGDYAILGEDAAIIFATPGPEYVEAYAKNILSIAIIEKETKAEAYIELSLDEVDGIIDFLLSLRTV